MVEKNNYRIVDIFKESPSEDTPQDPLSLDSLLIDPVIEKAKKLAGGKAAFDKQVEKERSKLLSGRSKKKSVGRAEPLDEDSFRIAAAYSIINKKASKDTPNSQP